MLCWHFLSIWCLPCATSLSDSASWQWPKGWEKQALPVSPPCRAGLAVTISHPATAQWRAQCQLWCSRQSSGAHPHEWGKTWYDVHRSPPKMRGQLCISSYVAFARFDVFWLCGKRQGAGDWSQGRLWRSLDDLAWTRWLLVIFILSWGIFHSQGQVSLLAHSCRVLSYSRRKLKWNKNFNLT